MGAWLLAASLVALRADRLQDAEDDPTRVAGWTLVDAAQRHPILVSQEPTTHLMRVAPRLERPHASQRAQVLDFVGHFRASDAGNSRLVSRCRAAAPTRSPPCTPSMRSAHAADATKASPRPSSRSRPTTPRAPAIRPSASSYLRYVAEAPAVRRLVDQSRQRADEPAVPESRLRARSATSPCRSPTRPISSVRAARRRGRASAAIVVMDKYVKGEPTGAEKTPTNA